MGSGTIVLPRRWKGVPRDWGLAGGVRVGDGFGRWWSGYPISCLLNRQLGIERERRQDRAVRVGGVAGRDSQSLLFEFMQFLLAQRFCEVLLRTCKAGYGSTNKTVYTPTRARRTTEAHCCQTPAHRQSACGEQRCATCLDCAPAS